MNVEIGAEAAQFPEKEYISGIAVAVRLGGRPGGESSLFVIKLPFWYTLLTVPYCIPLYEFPSVVPLPSPQGVIIRNISSENGEKRWLMFFICFIFPLFLISLAIFYPPPPNLRMPQNFYYIQYTVEGFVPSRPLWQVGIALDIIKTPLYSPPPPRCCSYLCTYDLYDPCEMFLNRADRYITRASGRGLGPGIESFWALWNGIKLIGECHLGLKKLEINRKL